MTSARICPPGLAVGDQPLDPRYPVGQIVKVTAQNSVGRIGLRLSFSGIRSRPVGDEDPASLVRGDQLLLAQNAERVLDRHGRNTIPAGQLPARWQAFTRFECSGRDACPQVIGDLQVGRPGVVRVRCHAFRVRRPSCLGRKRTPLGGLPMRAYLASLIQNALGHSSQEES